MDGKLFAKVLFAIQVRKMCVWSLWFFFLVIVSFMKYSLTFGFKKGYEGIQIFCTNIKGICSIFFYYYLICGYSPPAPRVELVYPYFLYFLFIHPSILLLCSILVFIFFILMFLFCSLICIDKSHSRGVE